ncbi:MAG: MFS transporter [Candidatus Tectomicrobia bacterium]|uniref:MFS transporter n=1 Tax=Tectimicrobiota bacterium TaxID=2528274 RepID=A0A933GKS5_UNCTE|nr:MFS transporter [Candidatus Tectomicrobia bacterium]
MGFLRVVPSKLRIYYGWRVVAVGFVLLLLMFGMRLSFGLYIKPLADNFGATRASISGSQSLYMVMYAVFALITGSLADRYGSRIVLAGGSLFMGLGMLLASQITSVWQYYLTYGVLVAIGSGAIYVPVIGVVSKFFTKQRNFALGITASGAGLGQFLIPPFMQAIVEVQGWKSAFFYTALLTLVFGVSLPWLMLKGKGLPEDAELDLKKDSMENIDDKEAASSLPADSAEQKPQKHYTLGQAMATAPFWTYFAMYFIVCFIMDGIVFVHMYPYLTDIGFSGQRAAKCLSFLGLISTIAMVALGPLGDRMNKRILLTSLLAAHTLLLLWLIHIGGEISLWGFTIFYGILLGAAWPLMVSLLTDIFGSRSVSSILGACTIAFGIAGLIAPWVAGYIFDLYKSYDPIFYFTILLSLGSIVCTYFTRPVRS